MLTRTLQHNFGELLEFAEISFSVRQPTINEQYKHRKIGSLAICRRSSSAVQHLPFEAVVILTRRTTSCCLSFDVFPSPPHFFFQIWKSDTQANSGRVVGSSTSAPLTTYMRLRKTTVVLRGESFWFHRFFLLIMFHHHLGDPNSRIDLQISNTTLLFNVHPPFYLTSKGF